MEPWLASSGDQRAFPGGPGWYPGLMPAPIYLDYAATTPVDPVVAEQMGRHLTMDGVFGNPGSANHEFGRRALRAVDKAREQVAALINADPHEIIWTSGATESDNLAITGTARGRRHRGQHIVTCKTEHKAVLDVCRELEREGFALTLLDPEPDGLLDSAALEQALRPDTVLVSIMHVNNEIGVVQDLPAIGRLTRERGILLHVDAAQGAGKIPIDVRALDVDLMSLTAHKIYGPKGIGALYVRRHPDVTLNALIHGGGQERGLRAGTLATHQIVGMGEAFRIAAEQLADDDARIRTLRERLWQGLCAHQEVHLNGTLERSVAGILNVSFPGVAGEDLLFALNDVAVSSGAACGTGDQEPSHVLLALGLDYEMADSAIRFSVGRFTTEQEIDFTIEAVQNALNRLRNTPP